MSHPQTLKQHLKPTLNQALIVVAFYISVLGRQLTPSYAINLPVSNPHHQVAYVPALRQNNEPTIYSRFESRKPIWNMAHMVNSIKELDYRLEKGANAVETDIKFSKDGDPLYTYHGVPCDCWRHCHQQEELPQFLRYARDITSDDTNEIGQNFTLLLLDLKLYSLKPRAKEKAGVELARSLVDNLFASSIEIESADNNISIPPRRGTHLKVVLSVNHVTDAALISYFIHQLTMMNSSHLLLDRIGFDVGMNDDIDMIESMWRRFRMPLNLWQGDGYTNCISPFYSALRLSKALVKRDSAFGYPKKVYQWSIDLHDRLRESLLLGVDAVMTNYPERLASILAEPAIAEHFRLATRDDDPFRKIYFRPSYRAAPVGGQSNAIRYQRSTNSANGGVVSTLMDTFSSCLNYLWEIPSFSLPTTSRFLSANSKRHKQSSLNLAKSDTLDTTSATTSSPSTTANSTTTKEPTTTTDSSVNSTTTSEEGRSATVANYTEASTNSGPTFEGPRWYTSLVSNLLVSAMKLAMPEES